MAKKSKKNRPLPPVQPATQPAPAPLPGLLGNTRLHLGLLFFGSVLLYANTFGHDYALDDAIVISENVFTKQGAAGIADLFRYDTFYGFFQDADKANLVSGGRYRPLTPALFAVEYQLFGNNPGIMHVFNALWYGLTVVVFYLLMRRLLDPRYAPGQAFFISLAAALIFLTHPVHTEAVANIKGRDEILSLLGSLAATYFVVRALRERRVLWSVLAGVVFFLGLLSKENAITFLAVVPLTLYYFSRESFGRIAAHTLPLLAATAVFLLLRASVVGITLNEPVAELMNNPFLKVVDGRYLPFTVGERSATILYTLGKYLQLLFVPYPLTHDYYPRHVPVMTWGDWQVWLSLLAYLALLGYAIWGLRRRDVVSYGIWVYLLTLSIVSNIVFPIGTNMSERFLFMPSVGFAVAVAALLCRLAERRQPPRWTPALAVLGGIILIFAVMTMLRNPAWHDNYTLFSTDIETAPNSAKLRNALGGELTTRYGNNTDRSVDALREAVGHLQEAVRIHPQYKNAYLLLGNAQYYLQSYEEAIVSYRRALELDPGYQEAAQNLPIALRDAGRFYGEQRGDLAAARRYLNEAYALQPDDYETARLLGVSYAVAGQPAEAIPYFTKATELRPDVADAWFDLGLAYTQSGQPEAGRRHLDRARQLDPQIESKRANPAGEQ